MIKKLIILLVISIFNTNICLAKIITTNNFNIIKNKVQSAENNTIVIFDIDYVLLQPKDYSLRYYYHNNQEQEKAKIFHHEIQQRLNDEQISEMLIQTAVEPIDNRMIELIDKIQKKGITVIALTARGTGKFGKIPSMENWGIRELKHLGYHFDKSWVTTKEKTFEQFPTKYLKQFPKFVKGVIFTCGVPKGQVLEAFLNYIKLHPTKILFIDDKRKNLESVASFAHKSNLSFLGIEYTFAKYSNTKPFNKKLAKFQFEILEKENKWLSDQQANAMLKKQTKERQHRN